MFERPKAGERAVLVNITFPRLDESSQIRFYRSLTPTHQLSKYLMLCLPNPIRIALARLMTSSHSLKVETGRWARPVTPFEEIFCDNCHGKIEDEYHLLVECPRYDVIRIFF